MILDPTALLAPQSSSECAMVDSEVSDVEATVVGEVVDVDGEGGTEVDEVDAEGTVDWVGPTAAQAAGYREQYFFRLLPEDYDMGALPELINRDNPGAPLRVRDCATNIMCHVRIQSESPPLPHVSEDEWMLYCEADDLLVLAGIDNYTEGIAAAPQMPGTPIDRSVFQDFYSRLSRLFMGHVDAPATNPSRSSRVVDEVL